MLVRYQYADGSTWEGSPEEAHLSPDPQPPEGSVYADEDSWQHDPEGGIMRMFAVDDFGNELMFTYEDFYYLYEVDGGWLFGASSPSSEFVLRPGQVGCSGDEVSFILPERAVVRRAVTVGPDLAVHFGFMKSAEAEIPRDKRRAPVECRDCD